MRRRRTSRHRLPSEMTAGLELVAVVAMAQNWVIGDGTGLLWHLPADLKRVKALTMGCPLIMGRRTWDSIGRALPGRASIVMTRDAGWTGEGALRAAGMDEALDLARAHKPDLILMDIQLPEVSGLEVTKWLKEDDELHRIPVIAVTAFAMKGDEERIRQGGCEAYISKPISVGKFIETIKSYLGDA